MTRNRLEWIVATMAGAPVLGFFAYHGATPKRWQPAVGWMAGYVFLSFLAWVLWRADRRGGPVPVGEYQAVVFLLAHAAYAVSAGALGDPGDWLIFLPPVGLIPPAVRLVRPSARAGVARAHALAAGVHGVIGGFLVLTIIAIVASPIGLVPAIFHWRAAQGYRNPGS